MKKEKDEDRRLVEQYLSTRSQTASARLVRKYHDSLFQFVLDRVKVEAEAEDLLQEIYTKMFNNLSSFNPKYAFSTWLFKIAENGCIDHLRKQSRKGCHRPFGTVPEKENGFSPMAACMEENPENEPSEENFPPDPDRLCGLLPGKYREVFLLRYNGNLKYREIAHQTGLPMGTVKTYLFRAKAVLNEKKQNKEKQDA